MTIHDILIADIAVGERRRDEFGDIEGLAQSIATYGLLSPITVNKECELVCGERRIRAFLLLGRTTIPAQIKEELTGDKLREVELEENLRRKDLTPYERSRTLADLADLTRSVALLDAELNAEADRVLAEADEEDFLRFTPGDEPEADLRSDSERKSLGRPVEPGSVRDVAVRIGRPPTTIYEAEAHVAAAEAYPRFKQPQWNQSTVLAARKALAKLPEEEREKAVAFVDEPGIPTKDAVGIIESLAEMEPAQREKVFALRESDDQREHDLAITTAAKKAACPDPRAVWFAVSIRELKQWVRRFPGDPLNERIEELIDTMKFLADEATRLHKERIENAAG